MKNIQTKRVIMLLLIACTSTWVQAGGSLVGTQFTYQGELLDNGSPANGAYDFAFSLWDQESNGTIVDSLFRPNRTVTNGLIQVDIDFGDLPFNGSELFLKVSVRPEGSSGNYEELIPRQRINVTPYAIQAEFTENGSSLWSEINDGIGYLNPVYVGDPNTVSSSLFTVDSAANVSPARIKIAGATRFIIRENGGTSIGANSSAPDNGLRVNGDTQLNGDLTQDVDNFGAIKAALTVTCSSSSSIDQSFNAVNNLAFAIDGSIATGNGLCAIDFPFSISNRFFIAMVKRQNDTRVASCNDIDGDTLLCVTSDVSGNLTASVINILIY